MKDQSKFDKYKKVVLWPKYALSFLLVIVFAIFIWFIFINYQKAYEFDVKASVAAGEFSDLMIRQLYVEVEKVIEENGEEKVVKVLERRRKKPAEREVKGIYLTAYGAAVPSLYEPAVKLIEETELNAVVIDIKDYSGQLSYVSEVPLVKELGADSEPKIDDMKKIIDELHEKGIYVIARQTIFQDPVLSKQKPEWAVQNKYTGRQWVDRKGLGWADPTVKEVWDYNIDIAKEAIRLGFDEINLDYIRFPTDGDMKAMAFHNFPKGKAKHEAIREFFEYFSKAMTKEPAYISADLFGLVTIKVLEKDDLGIGQLLVDAVPYFDYISPMVYPSHYAAGFNGYANPAEHPYEVVKYSMDMAVETGLKPVSTETTVRAKLRPWLQDFNMGAIYDASMVRKQINAAEEAGSFGWLLWDPRNIYTAGALIKDDI
jgi:hypothetical protein